MLTANRITYIAYLRDNPLKRIQIQVNLTDGDCGRCALGMAGDLIDGFPALEDDGIQQYEAIYAYLDLDVEESDMIWMMNDLDDKTFRQIADDLEEYWSSEKEN